jgi:hypothetical protein
VIEVKYDDFPVETGWTLRDNAGNLVAGQSGGGAVSKTSDIADGAYTFEMTGTYGDGIRCRYGASEFNNTVKASR